MRNLGIGELIFWILDTRWWIKQMRNSDCGLRN